MAPTHQPEIKVFWLNSSRAQRIIWLLEELDLNYDVVPFHRNKALVAPPELQDIHPLGKSPVVSIKPVGSHDPVILAESGFIIQYLSDHFGQDTSLVPRRFPEGNPTAVVGGETAEWMRFQYFLHYAEGSLMPYMTVSLILNIFRGDKIPRIIRPITALVARKVSSNFVLPNMRKHLTFLENQLATSPGNGDYLCGKYLTAADIIMRYPLVAAFKRLEGLEVDGRSISNAYPRLWAYLGRLGEEGGFKKAERRIELLEGKKDKEFAS